MTKSSKASKSSSNPFPHIFRAGNPEDSGLIYGTWRKSLYPAEPWHNMKLGEFKRLQDKRIDYLLNKPGVEFMVICHPTSDTKYGWICYEWDTTQPPQQFILHYLYIRKPYRRNGMATSLLERAKCRVGYDEIIATAWTRALDYQKNRWKLRFHPNPWLMSGLSSG